MSSARKLASAAGRSGVVVGTLVGAGGAAVTVTVVGADVTVTGGATVVVGASGVHVSKATVAGVHGSAAVAVVVGVGGLVGCSTCFAVS